MRWIALAAVGLMLVVPVVSATSFTQAGNGPQRTGAIDFEGPQTNDTAFEVDLPGVPVLQPALVDEDAYVATAANTYVGYDGDTENLTESALWRIDIDTGQRERVMDLPLDEGVFPLDPIAPDRLFMQDGGTGELLAIDVPSGEERWRVKALPDDPRASRTYRGAVQHGDTLYVGFAAWAAEAEDTAFRVSLGAGGVPAVAGVMAVDLATGQELWTWARGDDEPAGEENTPDMLGTKVPDGWGVTGTTLAADEDQVFLYTRLSKEVQRGADAQGEYAATQVKERKFELRVLDASDGRFLWNTTDTPQRRAAAYSSQQGVQVQYMTGVTCCAYPTVGETHVSMRLDAIEAFNLATGERLWTSPAGSSDQYDLHGSFSMGIREDTLVATSPQTVYRLDAKSGDVEWRETTPDQGFGNEPTVLDEATAYVPASPAEDDDNFHDIGIEARDLETGEVQWRWRHEPDVGIDDPGHNQDSSNPAYGPGIVLWPAKDGTVTTVGETEASLGEPDVPDELYPGAGNETRIDASGAESGAFGPATRYMVDWGDGTVSGWQEDPVFTHTYNESGEHMAQVYAGNAANQTSSSFVTMNVGQEAPAEPNMIETAFARENQDMTFGILGLLVAVTGGAIGVGRRYRKRSRLQDELETLEEGFEDTRGNPGECEAFLDTRKARARSLMMEGDLTEEQFGVLDARITELRRELRTGLLDERLQFLPYGMVQSLKRMLGDGEISTWERETIEELLEQDETLNEAQRERVRGMLERWSGPAGPTEGGGPA